MSKIYITVSHSILALLLFWFQNFDVHYVNINECGTDIEDFRFTSLSGLDAYMLYADWKQFRRISGINSHTFSKNEFLLTTFSFCWPFELILKLPAEIFLFGSTLETLYSNSSTIFWQTKHFRDFEPNISFSLIFRLPWKCLKRV